MILLALQGCSSFDEKFSSEKFMAENVDIIEADDVKASPFIKYKTPYLGEKIVYSEEKNVYLIKKSP